MSSSAFAVLLDKFANIPAVKLIDGDPQLVVSAKRGRFIILPSNGKLLVRPANDAQQPYVKYDPADLLAYLDSTDQQPSSPAAAKNFQTLIGSASVAAAAKAEAPIPPMPVATPAPIFGDFPSAAGKSAPGKAVIASIPDSAELPVIPPAPKAKKINKPLVYTVVALFVIVGAGWFWVFFGPPPADKPLPTLPPSDYDVVSAPDQLASLKKRFVGTYATSGDAGERLLEIKADGTFRYQEFGDSVSRTANRTGTYTFAYRHGTKTPLLRTSGLGTIEIRDEKNLLCQQAVFTKVQ